MRTSSFGLHTSVANKAHTNKAHRWPASCFRATGIGCLHLLLLTMAACPPCPSGCYEIRFDGSNAEQLSFEIEFEGQGQVSTPQATCSSTMTEASTVTNDFDSLSEGFLNVSFQCPEQAVLHDFTLHVPLTDVRHFSAIDQVQGYTIQYADPCHEEGSCSTRWKCRAVVPDGIVEFALLDSRGSPIISPELNGPDFSRTFQISVAKKGFVRGSRYDESSDSYVFCSRAVRFSLVFVHRLRASDFTSRPEDCLCDG